MRDVQWVISSNMSSQEDSANSSLFLFMNDRKGSRNPDEWNMDPTTSWIAKEKKTGSQFVPNFISSFARMQASLVKFHFQDFSSCFHKM